VRVRVCDGDAREENGIYKIVAAVFREKCGFPEQLRKVEQM